MIKFSKKYCCIVIIILLVLCSIIVSAGYSKPQKYRGLSGVNVGHMKPKIKYIQVGIPSNIILTSKQSLLKQKSLQLLGSSKGQNSFVSVATREQLLNSFKISSKKGKLTFD